MIFSRIALLSAVAVPLFATGPFTFQDVAGTGLKASEDGKPVFVYNYGMILKDGFPETMRRSTYLHPVYAPDGTMLTDDFNPDHPHHRGISWMWPVVKVDGKTYDLWTVGGIRQRFVRWVAKDSRPDAARLAVENGWYVGDRKVIREDVDIVVHPVAGDKRILDFTLRFEATGEPVEIAGTPDQNKGFGGFCFRFAPRDGGARKTVIRTDQSVLRKDGVLFKTAWAQIEGTIEGRPEGGRIDEDPSNPGVPNGWLLRHGFGFMNPSYPGLKALKLERGHPLVLKYRVTVFSGAPPA